MYLECPIESLAHIQDVTMTCWDADLRMAVGDGLLSTPRRLPPCPSAALTGCPVEGPDGKNGDNISSAAGVFSATVRLRKLVGNILVLQKSRDA